MGEKKEGTVIIAIDGPSGVGKSTISKKVASSLGFTYLDTGAMYRAVAFYLYGNGIDIDNQEAVEEALADIRIRLLPPEDTDDIRVLLNGEEVGLLIRTSEMSMRASKISAIPAVRKKLTEMQQQIGREGSVVAEGRDTTTVVFPHASFKFFLDATPEERSRRRMLQLKDRGEQADEKALLKQLRERDKNDSERSLAPLKKAEDAVYIDTTEMPSSQVLKKILSEIQKK